MDINILTLIPDLISKDDAISEFAMGKIINIGASAIPLLIKILEENDKHLVYKTIETLGNMKAKEAVRILIRYLKHSNSSISFISAQALGDIGDTIAVEPLIEVLEGDSIIRAGSIQALGKLKDVKAVQALIRMLKNENEDYYLRSLAAQALGDIGDTQAILPITEVLWSEDSSFIGSDLVDALGKFDQHQVISILIKALTHEDQFVQCSAARIIGTINSIQTIDILINFFQDKNRYIEARKIAVESLGQLKSKSAVKPLIDRFPQESDKIQYSIVEALGKIGDSYALPLLNTLLKKADESMMQVILESIEHIKLFQK
jgi:HEAT repeat protein